MGRVTGVILAGGQGTRFKPFTDIIPKPMIPLGPEEKPILEHIVSWLSKHGIRDLVLLVGYKWKQVYNYFRDGSHLGVRIRYSVDGNGYSGTGGALMNALLNGVLEGDTLLVWYGDIIAPLNPSELLSVHYGRGADATLALADRYQVPVGIAQVDGEGNVVGLEEKPWLPLKATIGILALRTSVLEELGRGLGKAFDIMGDLIPSMIRGGRRVAAYLYAGPWYDVGSLERYNKLDKEAFSEFLA